MEAQLDAHNLVKLEKFAKIFHSLGTCNWANKKQKSCKKESPPKRKRSSCTISLSPDPDGDELFLLSSQILRGKDAAALSSVLPPRALGFQWKLLYSTASDGYSLSSLYRKGARASAMNLPVILLIRDFAGGVFGAYLSTGWRCKESFYGDCSTFVFKCAPGPFVAFKWAGINQFFLQGKENFVSVGSSDGKFALWLDDALDHGRTDACETFGSLPLTEPKDFRVKSLEYWTIDNL